MLRTSSLTAIFASALAAHAAAQKHVIDLPIIIDDAYVGICIPDVHVL